MLMINHGGDNELWLPPGGGVQFGEKAIDALKREFREETGLEIEVGRFLFTVEFIQEGLHAIELFFEVKWKSGKILMGTDPELPADSQIIKELRYLSFNEIDKLKYAEKHGIFDYCQQAKNLLELQGFYELKKIILYPHLFRTA